MTTDARADVTKESLELWKSRWCVERTRVRLSTNVVAWVSLQSLQLPNALEFKLLCLAV